MPASNLTSDDSPLDLASELIYRFVAAALSDPRSEKWPLLFEPRNRQLVAQAAELLRTEFAEKSIPLGFGELPVEQLSVKRLFAALDAGEEELLAQHARIFGLITCRECPPYETEYQPNGDTFFRSQQMADVAGFYHAFGVEPTCTARERPDHLVLELEFSALLLLKKRLAAEAYGSAEHEAVTTTHQARAHFFRDHISWWVPSFALALRRKSEDGLYAAVGEVLGAFLPIERHRLGVAPPLMPLEVLQTPADDVPTECAGCSLAPA